MNQAIEQAQVRIDSKLCKCSWNLYSLQRPFGNYGVEECICRSRQSGLMVSSTKSMTGHLLGAVGAIEAAAICKAIEENVVGSPTINYEEPDPDCDLDYIPNESRNAEVNAVMSNNSGFGGYNASLVFRRV